MCEEGLERREELELLVCGGKAGFGVRGMDGTERRAARRGEGVVGCSCWLRLVRAYYERRILTNPAVAAGSPSRLCAATAYAWCYRRIGYAVRGARGSCPCPTAHESILDELTKRHVWLLNLTFFAREFRVYIYKPTMRILLPFFLDGRSCVIAGSLFNLILIVEIN